VFGNESDKSHQWDRDIEISSRALVCFLLGQWGLIIIIAVVQGLQ
jgi:hypothetical protein